LISTTIYHKIDESGDDEDFVIISSEDPGPMEETAKQFTTSISNAFSSIFNKISEVATEITRPSDEDIARKLQEEEKLEFEKKRLEEEQLSQQYINQLMANGEIRNPVSPRTQQRQQSPQQFPQLPQQSPQRQPFQMQQPQTFQQRNVRLPPGLPTGNIEQLNMSLDQLFHLIEGYQGSEETKRRLRELFLLYQQQLLLSGYSPARTRDVMPTFIWEGKNNTSTVGEKSEVEASCSICLSDYEVGNEIKILPCLHKFHGDCIDHWFVEHNTCPVCKTKVD